MQPNSATPPCKPSPPLDVSALSGMSEDMFVAALDGIFEHSPWVARRVARQRPFANQAALADALEAAMMQADQAEQLALIRAHPELAGKAAVAGELTKESTQEQGGAGLNACSQEEFARLQALNAAYNARFGHPFILAVRGYSRAEIIAIFARRLENEIDEERQECLDQIARIARLRLADRFAP